MHPGSGVRRLRTLATVAAVLAAVLPGVAGAATPGPTLAGSVTVSGRGSGYVPVTLPRAVDVRSELERPTVRFTGGAYGWALVTNAGPKGRGYASVVKMPAAQGGAPVLRLGGLDPRTGSNLFFANTIPAGAYRLYLLTNGVGSATLRLPGLRGTASFGVRAGAAPATTVTLASVNGVAPPAFASGVTFGDASPTLLMTYHWIYTAAQAAAHYGWCDYGDGEPPGGQWLPGCPGSDVALIGAYGVFTGCCGVGTGGGIFEPGRRSYGHFYDTAGVVENAGDLYVVLPLR
jgi:hypothetical protein